MLFSSTFSAVLLHILLLLIWSSNGQAEWSEFLVDTEVSYHYHDNINRTVFDNEVEHEQVWSALVSAGRVYQLSNNTRLFAKVHVDASKHKRFGKLNQLSAGASLLARHKFGMGAYRPWVSASVTSSHIFSRSDLREGQLTTTGVALGKRIHERLEMSLNYRFDYRDSITPKTLSSNKLIANGVKVGKSSSVFDTSGHSVGVQFNALLTPQWILTLKYNFRHGDIVSSNAPKLIPKLDSIINAIAFDDALPGWAYRSRAQTHRYSVDANYAFFKGHAAFNIGYEFLESYADAFTYRNNLYRVNLIYSF